MKNTRRYEKGETSNKYHGGRDEGQNKGNYNADRKNYKGGIENNNDGRG